MLSYAFDAPMLGTPTLTFYNPSAGSADKIRDEGGGANRAVGDVTVSSKGWSINNLASGQTTTASTSHAVMWVAEREL